MAPQTGIIAKSVSAWPNDQSIALMADGCQEIGNRPIATADQLTVPNSTAAVRRAG